MTRYTRLVPTAVLVAVLAGAGPLTATVAASPAPVAWSSVQSAPVRGARAGSFYAISCPATYDCIAVGTYTLAGKGSYNTALVEAWHGNTWSVVGTPALGNGGNSQLDAISCTSTSNCVAVGDYAVRREAGGVPGEVVETLVESWDGRSWAVVPSPNASSSTQSILNGVACVAGPRCFAVGSSGLGPTAQMLIESWDGRAWSIDRSPSPAGSQADELYAVSCPAVTSCMAVGFDQYPGGSLLESWDGRDWSQVSAPKLGNSSSIEQLYGVTCTARTACVAVGSIGNGNAGTALIESWDGRDWSVTSTLSPTTAQNVQLNAVACLSPSSCTAVGSYNVGTGVQSLIESSSGGKWSLVSSPTVRTAEFDSLFALACPSPGRCTSVGNFDQNIDSNVQPLVETTAAAPLTVRSSWAMAPSEDIFAAGDNELTGVSCVSALYCTAVGFATYGHDASVLVERWDGKAWSLVKSPNTKGAQESELGGISCVSPANCVAVGFAGDGAKTSTLIESWDGQAWSVSPSPNGAASSGNELASVSCASSASCFAVGFDVQGGVARTLAEHWNGRTWSVVRSANAGAREDNELEGVSCASAKACIAVGSVSKGRTAKPLAESWDGRTWALLASRNVVASEENELGAVSCASPTWCTAVGYVGNGPTARTLVESWDGAAWSVARSANSATAEDNQLSGISCTAADACTAVGFVANGSTARTLIERWDGRAWSIVSSPDPPTTQSVQLAGVSCTTSSRCTAAGYYTSLQTLHQRTLAEIER